MEKLLVGSARHLEYSKSHSLSYLMLHLPFACDYNCTQCCNKVQFTHDGPPLSLVEIKSLIDEAKSLSFSVLVIAGEGEPLLDRNFREIVRIANEKGLMPYIFTNGRHLNPDMLDFLKHQNASLVINLNSLKEEAYESLNRRPGSCKEVQKNIANLRAAFSDTHAELSGYGLRRIAINTVLSKLNKEEIPKIIDFCGDDFVFVLNTPMIRGNAIGDHNFEDVKPRIETIPLGTTSDMKWCAYMRNGISIGSSGEILACAYALECSGYLGNVRQGGLKKYMGAANKVVDNFYAAEGHSRCIVRHQQYPQFINRLKGKK